MAIVQTTIIMRKIGTFLPFFSFFSFFSFFTGLAGSAGKKKRLPLWLHALPQKGEMALPYTRLSVL
jgi:hypothetical protein